MNNRSVASCVTGPLLRFDHCVSTYAALQAVYYYYYYQVRLGETRAA